MTNRNILLLVDEIFEKKKNKSVEYKITLQKNRKAAAAFEKNRDVSMVNYIIYPSPPGASDSHFWAQNPSRPR